MAVKKILGTFYEPRFLNCMYGFRPNRGCHEAIKEVYQRISYGKISYIVDADIKGFFDHIDHDWMMKFLEWNIQDKNCRARGECKPETFDFLGFTFYCSKTRKGCFVSKVQTSRKKFEQKVRVYKNWIYDNRNRPMREIIKELNVKLIGHYRYYGVTWNFRKITTFLHRVQQFLFKAMNRRGCRRAYTWNGFVEMLKYYPLAKPKTYYCLY